MTTLLRPSTSGAKPPAQSTVDPRAGTRVALGFPLVAVLLTVSWLVGSGHQPEFSVWTFLVLPAICAGYGLFPVVLGSRAVFSFELPTVVLAGLIGGPLAGVLAGVATGLGDVGAVWRRRSTYAGLAMIQGFGAGVAGNGWQTGAISLPVAVVIACGAAFALSLVGHVLVLVDRQSWPSPWLVRGSILELLELVVSCPLLVLLGAASGEALGLVSLVAASTLAGLALGAWILSGKSSLVDGEGFVQLLDPLTGALSRVAFEAALAREQEKVLRGERSAGLLICDIDHFGRFNEQHGHLGGDRALRYVVERIQAGTHGGDLVARWGGEEICVIAPGVGSLADLEALGERVRQSVAARPLELEREDVTLTVSVGATLLADWSTAEETFSRADEALYQAKRTRNAVCVLGPCEPGDAGPAWALASA
jgi:diguanylate cyclase (GGDEF)-like protein